MLTSPQIVESATWPVELVCHKKLSAYHAKNQITPSGGS